MVRRMSDFLLGFLIAFCVYHGIYIFFKEKRFENTGFDFPDFPLPVWLKRGLNILLSLMLIVLMASAVVELAAVKDRFDTLGCDAMFKPDKPFITSLSYEYGYNSSNYTYDEYQPAGSWIKV